MKRLERPERRCAGTGVGGRLDSGQRELGIPGRVGSDGGMSLEGAPREGRVGASRGECAVGDLTEGVSRSGWTCVDRSPR